MIVSFVHVGSQLWITSMIYGCLSWFGWICMCVVRVPMCACMYLWILCLPLKTYQSHWRERIGVSKEYPIPAIVPYPGKFSTRQSNESKIYFKIFAWLPSSTRGTLRSFCHLIVIALHRFFKHSKVNCQLNPASVRDADKAVELHLNTKSSLSVEGKYAKFTPEW